MNSRWNMSKSVQGDDGGTLKKGDKPKVEGVVGHASRQDEVTANDSTIPSWAADMLAHFIILPPHPLDDCRCESIHT